MSTLTALARLAAASADRAVPVRTVRHVHISDQPLVFVPIALAGEANAPLAAMVGDNRLAPTVLVVAEPRDRSQRFAFAADLADIAGKHISGGAAQILVPNPAAATFTRLLGRSTRFRSTTGPYPVPAAVPLLGRWLSFYAERREHPGSSLLVPMTSALSAHWATGQSATEDAHLGSLLAWIDPPDGLSGSAASLLAEDPVRCPPAGPATDPTFDLEVLDPCLTRVREARFTGRGVEHAVTALTEALTSQLAPTWELMWRGVDLLRSLPAGDHVASRWGIDVAAFEWHAEHIREGGPPQARLDGAVAAARRLATLEREQERLAAEQAFDDPMVMAEHRLAGEAFVGRVVAAEPERLVTSGKRRILRPLVTVATSETVPSGPLHSPARPSQEATVISRGDGEVTLELKGGMGRSLVPEPGSVPAVGEEICYASFGLTFSRVPGFPSREETPWTHGGPPPEYEPSEEEAREEWS